MNILLLSHERSVNKAEALIRFLSSTQHKTFLVTEFDVAPYKLFAEDVNRITVVDFEITEILKSCPKIDKVITISENLLPLQCELETHYGIRNLPSEAGQVLSNKQRLHDYCQKIGLADFTPQTVTPLQASDLQSFNKKMILKPDIGTGMNQFYYDPLRGLEYSHWNSGSELLEHLDSRGLLDSFLQLNKSGIANKRFNHVPCRMLLQEYVESMVPSIAPCGFVRNGKVFVLFYVTNIKLNQVKQFPAFQQAMTRANKNQHDDKSGDFAIFSKAPNEVDPSLNQKMTFYWETLAKNLDLNDLFFAGPDFHIQNQRMFAIDLNPRPGNFYNMLDKANNGSLTRAFFTDAAPSLSKQVIWAAVPVNQTTNRKRNWIKKFSGILGLESQSMQEGEPLSEVPYLQSRPKSIQVYLAGQNQDDLMKTYQTVSAEIGKEIDGNR